MNQQERLTIFRAQTENVRRLTSAVGHVRRAISHSLRRGDNPAEEAHTLLYALVYCAWLEALFSKLIHTPHGFALDEIEQIAKTQEHFGIHRAWQKCVELGARRVPGARAGDVANMRRKLSGYLDAYIQEPALLRNKIAHGQWSVALNRTRTAVNNTITAQLANLDIVIIDRWSSVASHIVAIIEALIESPDRSFRREYWVQLAKLDEAVLRMQSWTRASRQQALKLKPIPRAARVDAVTP